MDTYLDDFKKVPISMFKENRDKLAQSMNTNKGAIVLQGGSNISIYDTDVNYLFRQESSFMYLFGINEPNCYGVIDLTNNLNTSILFITKPSPNVQIFMGKYKGCDYYKQKYGIDLVYCTDEISTILKSRAIDLLYTNKGTNINSKLSTIEAKFNGIEQFTVDNTQLYSRLCECRVIKSEKELDLLRFINKISYEAHIHVMKQAKYCTKESDLEAEFLYYIQRYYGCRYVSYTCICCSGQNGSILHYGHAGAPNDRKFFKSDMLLLDMGAEYYGYDSDITCSFPVNGQFTDEQKKIYNAVLNTQKVIESQIKNGVNWTSLQFICLSSITQELIKIGLINQLDKTIEELVLLGVPNIFMPHYFGHSLGLDTHDVDTSAEKRSSNLRTGMVITNEPGIYFMEDLLNKAFENPDTSKYFNKENIAKFSDFGGVRLEDDIIVLENGCENMTQIPREINEIENIMKMDIVPICQPCQN